MRCKRAVEMSILIWQTAFMCSPSGITQSQEGKLDDGKSEKQESSKNEVDTQAIEQFYEGKLLKGRIELSNSLPKVTKKFMPGHRYPENPSEGLNHADKWYRIPDWIAGRWQSVYENGTPTQPKARFRKGTIRDAEGSLWDIISVPYEGVVEDIPYTIRRLSDYSDQLIDSQGCVQVRTHYLTSGVDERGKIIRTLQEETVATYLPKRDGVVEVIHTGKRFDLNGKYLNDVNSRVLYSRIQQFPFEPKPNKAVQKSFKNYLKSNGLERLIPASLN